MLGSDNLVFATVGAAFTVGDTTLTLGTGQGSMFSFLGSGVVTWLRCADSDTAPTYEILLRATGRSGDVLTVDATPASRSSGTTLAIGDKVSIVITKEALAQLVTDASGGSGHTIQVSESAQTQRANLDFVPGSGVTITPTDDSANNRTKLTFTATGGGGGSSPGEGLIPDQGLYIWLAADSIAGLSDGDTLSTWLNKVDGPNAFADDSSTATLYKTSIVNGLPVVRLQGGSWLKMTAPELFSAFQVGIFIVLKLGALSNAYSAILKADHETGSSLFGWFVKSNGKTALYTSAANYDGSGSGTIGTSSFYVMSLISHGIGVNSRVALADDYASTSSDWRGSQQMMGCIGNDESNGGRTLTADIAELIVYRRATSSAERDTIESYLKTKYGL